jgi:hypothetical protein
LPTTSSGRPVFSDKSLVSASIIGFSFYDEQTCDSSLSHLLGGKIGA